MNSIKLLKELVIKGWKFWNNGDKLLYDAPSEQLTSELLAQLKQHKVEIIKLLQKEPDIFNVHPLSYSQKALWFIWELEPESAAHNVVFSARIFDDLNVALFRAAFIELVDRHPCLRSTFPKLGEQPIRQVHQNFQLDWRQIDASSQDEAELYSRVVGESKRSFNLAKELIIRIRLFTISASEHILLITIHHIAIDGWSLDIILSELPKLYQAKVNGVCASLTTLKNSYSDYVRSQEELLEGTEGEKLFHYWESKLEGELPVLNLPTDKPRPAIQTYNGASIIFELSEQLSQKLKQLAIDNNATLYMTLLAAFQVLLYHYTGTDDFLVGSPVAGRLQSQFREIVGYFVNLVVLRGNLSNNPSFKEFLNQIRQTVNEALIHQNYPFSLLVEKLQPYRDSSRSPIFQVSFALQQLRQSRNIQNSFVDKIGKNIYWGGLKSEPLKIPQQEGQNDLDLEILEGSSSIKGSFKYNTDLFNSQTIERMVGHFQNLLEAIVENPDQKVGSLNLLSESERHQLLVEWNDTATEYPSDKCIHQLFEEQVEKTPDAVAVIFEEQQLTYRQLNQRANQLAHHLQNLGVKPEVLVGICVERSIEMVVGLLGILKAGGAYVPLDPNYPPERLSYMLADSNVGVLLTQDSLQESLPEHNAQVICLDTDWGAIKQYSKSNLNAGASFDNLAYVIYTSGSTGKPKGVMIIHGGMANYLNWCTKTYNIADGVGSVVNSSIGFDATITSLFAPLLVGGKVVLLPKIEEIEALKAALSSGTKFSLIKITPAHLEILSHLLEFEQINIQTQAFIIGGEALSEKVASFWQQYAPTTGLINEYGPTETVVGCCIYKVEKQSFSGGNIPIGRPIANTEIYILDSPLQPVPVGVPGELHIGGDGLARGYLNRPQLTSEKFIENPFNKSSSKRLYKTGDLARYLSDGNIEFLGRIDNQVKIRGFRIELGEIEVVLASHPQVNQTVVIAVEESTGNKRLVAYIVADSEITTQQLREHLKAQLPEYMVPSAFVILSTIPLTPNGKVDRQALPALDINSTREHEYVPPQTETEKHIAVVFQEMLQLEKISIYDNFFELGANSLILLRINSKLQEKLSMELSVIDMFTYPNIKSLSQHIANRNTTKPPLEAREISREAVKFRIRKRLKLRGKV
ncbi:Linear gramicidin synthase subunit B (fragment) [Hyella patelloides LEGE 07179]|uniref:Linear gramicidin synthase subunit B n=1 Tax=Hyella patelloides LEGE 07179 TaxID=945734 RepID=A0A563VQQ2_9CYAN